MCGKFEQIRNICMASTCSCRNLGSTSCTVMKSHITRRQDILQPWTRCTETAVRSLWPPAQMHELNLSRSSGVHTQTEERSNVIEQHSSVSRSHQAREDGEVSRLGETEALHLVTKCSARPWLSRVRSCYWPYPMSALGRTGERDTGTVCVIFATR